MRSGKPCPCGCCVSGYPCSNISYSNNLYCPSFSETTTLLYFNDTFDNPLSSGWQTGQVTYGGNGHGVASSGDGLYDYVNGEGLPDPYFCARLNMSCSIFTNNKNIGMARFGMAGGPVITVTGGNAYLSTPDGSGALIDDSYKSGDNYSINLFISKFPISEIRNEISVDRRRNSNTSVICPSSIEVGDTTLSIGTNDGRVIQPYGSGCPYTSCSLFRGLYIDLSGSDNTYNINSPSSAYIESSGNLWEFDDFCVDLTHTNPSNLIGLFGQSGVDIVVNSGTISCNPLFSCDQITDKPWFTWSYPCFDSGFSGPTVKGSGQTPAFLWRAYVDDWIMNVDDFRCVLAPPGSSEYAYLRTEIEAFEQDLTQNDIWHICLLQVNQEILCEDSIPFDEEVDCLHVTFSGSPCNDGDCYSYPFYSLDNILYTRYEYDQGNVTYSGECLQAGQASSFYPYIAPFYNRMDMITIPRDDDYSVVRYYHTFGDIPQLDYNMDRSWRVQKLATMINWDDTNKWWHGNYKFLSASGTTSVPNAGNEYQNIHYLNGDLSHVYKSGECDNYDIYFYERCAEGGVGIPYVDIFSNSGAKLESRVEFNKDIPGGETGTSLLGAASCTYNLSMLKTMDGDIVQGENSVVYGQMGTYSYNYEDYFNLGYEPKECNPVGSGCVEPSGYYGCTLKGFTGYKLLTDDFVNDYFPHILLDTMGCPIIRGGNYTDFNTSYFLNMAEVYDPTTIPNTCLIEFSEKRIYNLIASDTADLMFDPANNPSYIEMDPCGTETLTNLPFWAGTCLGKVSQLSFSPLTSPTFNAGDYTSPYLPAIEIRNVTLLMFYDKLNSKFRAFAYWNGSIPFFGDVGFGPATYWYDPPGGFYKSESDMLNNTYFAEVTIVTNSPLKLMITQTFMALGNPNDGTLEDGCEKYVPYPYKIDIILEEPEYV